MNEHFHNDSVTWSTGFTRIVTTLAAKQAKGVIMCNTRLAQDGSQGRCSAPIISVVVSSESCWPWRVRDGKSTATEHDAGPTEGCNDLTVQLARSLSHTGTAVRIYMFLFRCVPNCTITQTDTEAQSYSMHLA